MRVLICGDLHGDTAGARAILRHVKEDDIDVVLQCGDFGYWPKQPRFKEFWKTWSEISGETTYGAYWVDGNHEDHPALNEMVRNGPSPLGYLHRGALSTIGDGDLAILSLGGAVSVDRDHRTQGLNWFYEEAPSFGELSDMFNAATKAANHPGELIVISHEAPAVEVPFRGLPWKLPEALTYASTMHRMALEGLYHRLEQLRGDFHWFHGHWHARASYKPSGGIMKVTGLAESRQAPDLWMKVIEV